MKVSIGVGRPFLGLKARSYYSFWDGVNSPGQLVRAAGEWGAEAVALCDRNLLAGVPEFIDCCRESGISTVVGCEFEAAASGRLTLLARSLDGYRDLLALSTLASAGLPLGPELLQGRTAGLVGMFSPSPMGDLAGLMALRDHFDRENLWLELPWDAGEDYLAIVLELSRLGSLAGSGVGLVATAGFHLSRPADAHLARLARRVAGRRDVPLQRGGLPPAGAVSPPAGVDRDVWQRASGAAWEVWTHCAALRIDNGARDVLPTFPTPGDLDESSFLRSVALAGANQRGVVGSDALDRLERELQLVTARGLAGYFLILWDLVRFARQEGIPIGPGRGSAVGSLLAYCLGITEVNPLDHGLLFERFLNEDRPDLPDVDLDLGHRRRSEVVEYLKRIYGHGRVVHQGVITRLGARGAVRAAGRALGTDPAIVDRVAKLLPQTRGQGGLAESLRTVPEARGLPLGDQRVGSLIRAAMLLEGLPTGFATHGSALIVSPRPAIEDLPLTLGAGGQVITQYGPETVTALGFPKFDLLGLRNLTLIDDTITATGLNRHEETIPINDRPTWQMIGNGETIGCFQLDSPGMREVLRATRPENLAELTAALSLYRPGPWDPGALGAYVRRKEGKEEVPALHPLADPILRETHGVLLFQEQALELARAVAGFSLGEADRFRRDLASGKGEQWRQMFVERACALGSGLAAAQKVFNLLRRFSGYSFNKAHVTAYALISYRTAYLKAHYPELYFPFLVASDSGYFPPDVYRLEASRLGVEVSLDRRQLTLFDRQGGIPEQPAGSHPGDRSLVLITGPIASCRRQEDRRGRPMLELLIRQGDQLLLVSVPAAVYARDVLELDPAGVVVQAHRRSGPGQPERIVARRIRAIGG